MSIKLEDREAFLAVVDKLCREKIGPRAAQIDSTGEFPWDVHRAMSDVGLLALGLPEEYGGVPVDLWTRLLITERITRSSTACAFVFDQSSYPSGILARWASESIKSRYLPGVASGDMILSFAVTEPTSGSDAAGMTTRAVETADGFRITGSKHFISGGSVSNAHVVFAKTSLDAGAHGISAFIVPAESPGVSVGRDEDLLGGRGHPASELFFDDVHVPAEALLGERDAGFRIAMATIDEARLTNGVSSLALARGALEYAVEYAKKREQFGQPIITFQGLQFMLAEMTTDVAAGWALLERAYELLASGPSRTAGTYTAMVKLFCTNVGMKVTTDAVQVFGGLGLTRQVPVERMMRDAKVFQIIDGTNQIQKVIIGRHLIRHEIPIAPRDIAPDLATSE